MNICEIGFFNWLQAKAESTVFVRVIFCEPLAECADLLASWPWPQLYDPQRLRDCEVPCAAAIYAYDLYVERDFSEQTAALIGGLRPWLTNAYEHNGLRADGERILGRLIDLARGPA